MRVFHAGKRRLPAWTRPQLADNAFTERAPNHASACLGVMLVNCQLSGGADTSQEGRPTSTRSLRRLGPAKPLSLQPVIGWLTRLKEAGSGRDSHRTSKRQEFLRFPITRCNFLLPWSLCAMSSPLLVESSEYFTIISRGQERS